MRTRSQRAIGRRAAAFSWPWTWIFQYSIANENVASGLGFYGLSRLVAASGGRYYLYYPPTPGGHSCSPYGCRLCSNDHAECGGAYAMHKLRDIAPALVSRVEARRTLARDPLFAMFWPNLTGTNWCAS